MMDTEPLGATLRREMQVGFARVECLAVEREKHYMARFDEQEKTLQTAVMTVKQAVDKAETSANKEFENANNVKAEFAAQLMQLIPRVEVDARFSGIEKDIDDLTKLVARSGGRTIGLNAGWGYLVGGVGIVAVVLTWIIH